MAGIGCRLIFVETRVSSQPQLYDSNVNTLLVKKFSSIFFTFFVIFITHNYLSTSPSEGLLFFCP